MTSHSEGPVDDAGGPGVLGRNLHGAAPRFEASRHEVTALTAGEGLRRAGRSVSALAAGEALNKLTRFFATVLLARNLELSAFGLVNVGIAISGILLSLTALGLPEFGAREVAIAPARIRQVAGLVLVTRMSALALASGVAILGTVILAPAQTSLVGLATLMTVGLSGSADWLLRGRERMTDVAGATALGGLVVLAGSASIVVLVPTAAVAMGVFALGEGVAGLATWWRASAGRPELPSLATAKNVVRATWPLGASGLIIYASYANLDTILLAAVRSDAEAGLYSAPYRLFLAANAVPLFAAYALLPMLARRHDEGRTEERRRLLLRTFLPLAGYGMLTLGLTEVLGGPLLSALFGHEFAGTRSILVVLMVALPWYAIGFPSGYSLIGEQRNRHFFRGAAVAGALNLLLMGLLIPSYGIDGAAIATTAALVGGALVWLLLADAVRPMIWLCLTLTLASLFGLVAARSASLSDPIGLVTGAVGLTMIVKPILRRLWRPSR